MSETTVVPSSVDAVFDALADGRRRRVLRHLDGRHAPVAVSELARNAAARHANGGDAAREAAEDIYISLRHVHVPKLADVGLIEYDSKRETVARTALATRVDPFLEWAAEHGDSR